MLFESEAAQTVAAIVLAMRRYVDDVIVPNTSTSEGTVCVYCWDAATAADAEGGVAVGEAVEEPTMAQ